ncbi:hypothetical protein FVW27_12710, partial [Desulfovibrio sp. XJ01]|nr:hypothetical protein [Nitratidesulfovibrio liaohensis]
MARPVRLRIPNELGQFRTLPDEAGPDDVAPDKAGPDGNLPDNIAPDKNLPDRVLPGDTLPATFDVLPPRGQRGDVPTEVVVLGLGPNPATARRALEGALAGLRKTDARSGKHSAPAVHVIECPAFIHHMEEATRGTWRTAIPVGWVLAAPDDFPPDRLARALVVVYREAERLFPTFWGPLLGAARAVRMAPALA